MQPHSFIHCPSQRPQGCLGPLSSSRTPHSVLQELLALPSEDLQIPATSPILLTTTISHLIVAESPTGSLCFCSCRPSSLSNSRQGDPIKSQRSPSSPLLKSLGRLLSPPRVNTWAFAFLQSVGFVSRFFFFLIFIPLCQVLVASCGV